MKRILPYIIPFLYYYKGSLVFKRKYILDGEVIIKFIIYYKVDSLTYYTIKEEYYLAENSNKEVEKIITTIIDELKKITD
jgi:hypothetical protein